MDKIYIVYSVEENSYPNFYGAYRTRQEAECVAKTHPNHTYAHLEIEEINIESFDITPYKYHRYTFFLSLKSKGENIMKFQGVVAILLSLMQKKKRQLK